MGKKIETKRLERLRIPLIAELSLTTALCERIIKKSLFSIATLA